MKITDEIKGYEDVSEEVLLKEFGDKFLAQAQRIVYSQAFSPGDIPMAINAIAICYVLHMKKLKEGSFDDMRSIH